MLSEQVQDDRLLETTVLTAHKFANKQLSVSGIAKPGRRLKRGLSGVRDIIFDSMLMVRFVSLHILLSVMEKSNLALRPGRSAVVQHDLCKCLRCLPEVQLCSLECSRPALVLGCYPC